MTVRMILRGSRIRLTMSPMNAPTLMIEKNRKPKNRKAATIIQTRIHIPRSISLAINQLINIDKIRQGPRMDDPTDSLLIR